jgi:hypothetical protein
MPSQRNSVPRVCAHCNAEFLATKDQVKRGDGRFCSRRCASSSPAVPRRCAACGIPFAIRPSVAGRGHGVFCSIACRVAAKRQPVADRFWSHVDRSGECWIWTASDTGVYGQFHPTPARRVTAHRFAYELTHGCVPAGLWVLHHCDVPLCVRPEHLYAGTREDNMRDMLDRGRHARGDRHRSRLYPERLPRGEDHVNSVLTEAHVRGIRRLGADNMTRIAIARLFGIGPGTVGKILRRELWGHVE